MLLNARVGESSVIGRAEVLNRCYEACSEMLTPNHETGREAAAERVPWLVPLGGRFGPEDQRSARWTSAASTSGKSAVMSGPISGPSVSASGPVISKA
jgi:hypothetical protein